MPEPFLGEIKIISWDYPPLGWALCNGQLLPISQNQALFSLLGTTYGGDGRTTFALPNLQGRAPLHQGQGPGLAQYFLGETGGAESVTLLESQIPAHSHLAMARGSLGNQQSPANNTWSGSQLRPFQASANTQMDPNAVTPAGGDQPHNNMLPYLVLRFIIALQGDFPQR